MKLAVLGFFALVVLSACGLVPPKPEDVKTADNNGLCYGYGKWLRARDVNSVALIQSELKTRGVTFTMSEDAGIMEERRGIFIGMTECALIAALGPNQFHVNETLTANTR